MAKYRKKPIVVEANQWWELGDDPNVKQYACDAFNMICPGCGAIFANHGEIKTLEGEHIVCPKDWIITGVKGEKYPVKDEIFEQTYEKVED